MVRSPLEMESSRDDDKKFERPIEFSRSRWSCTCGNHSGPNLANLLCFSFVFNIVFVVLFVVVFIQLENVQTRLQKLESPLIEEPSKVTARPLRENTSRTPFPLISTNVTSTPILLKVRAFTLCY